MRREIERERERWLGLCASLGRDKRDEHSNRSSGRAQLSTTNDTPKTATHERRERLLVRSGHTHEREHAGRPRDRLRAVATPSRCLDELLAEQLCCFRRSTVPTGSIVVAAAVIAAVVAAVVEVKLSLIHI